MNRINFRKSDYHFIGLIIHNNNVPNKLVKFREIVALHCVWYVKEGTLFPFPVDDLVS